MITICKITNTLYAHCNSAVNFLSWVELCCQFLKLELLLLLDRKAFWIVVSFTSHSNIMSADMVWVARRYCSVVLVDVELPLSIFMWNYLNIMSSMCCMAVTCSVWFVGLLVHLTSKYATSMSLTHYITMELSQLLCLVTMITLRQPKHLTTFTQPCRCCKSRRRLLLKLHGAVRSHRWKTVLHHVHY